MIAVIISTLGIVCANRSHGEHGVIARIFTRDHGLVAGYVRGGKSRTLRPILIPANIVKAEMRARLAGQLPGMSVELVQSRGQLMGEPLAAAALEWGAALTAYSLPEEHPYPEIYQSLDALFSAIEAAPTARAWSGAMAAYEALLLKALGFGGNADGLPADWTDTFAMLNRNGAQMGRHLFQGRGNDILSARARLIDRLKRAVA